MPIGINEPNDFQQNAFNFETSPFELSTGIESFMVEPVGTSSVCIYINPLYAPLSSYFASIIAVSVLELTFVNDTVANENIAPEITYIYPDANNPTDNNGVN